MMRLLAGRELVFEGRWDFPLWAPASQEKIPESTGQIALVHSRAEGLAMVVASAVLGWREVRASDSIGFCARLEEINFKGKVRREEGPSKIAQEAL
jgi:hypothetical protein